jgi:murein DD-endopeptidase MepM/ murein hydrolase activator NlpD
MRILPWVFLLLLAMGSGAVSAQENKPVFINPLHGVLRFSGTFGELRGTHFHAGIDLKTAQVEGKPVMAVDDGYISRIAVSPSGYGKALYINHPGGYTTVYAHLQRMKGNIETFLLKKHYELQSYRLDVSLKPDELPVKKGDTIAWSGNSGSSGGPHLHFEVRETATQAALNPLHYGFRAKDFIRPTLLLFKAYPAGHGSLVNGSPVPVSYELAGWGPKYRLRTTDTLSIAGSAWFGLKAHDLLNDEPNKNGIYAMSLFIDSVEVFGIEFSRLYFDKARYINALCDYPEYRATGRRVVNTRKAPCNRLNIYKVLKDNGVYTFLPDSLYRLKFVVTDHYGNESVLRLVVKGAKEVYAPFRLRSPSHIQFACEQSARWDTVGFQFIAPERAFYDTVNFRYRRMPAPPAYYSDFHVVHNPNTPIHEACTLRIIPDRLPERLKKQALIAKVDEKGKPAAAGGKWDGEWLTVSIRDFGTYAIMADTLPPVVSPVNFVSNQPLKNKERVNIRIKDEFSGIKSYVPTLNGNWILMEYDAKNNLLSYFRDAMARKGRNTLNLKVTDEAGNEKVVEYILIF